jgi:hypothetical protein
MGWRLITDRDKDMLLGFLRTFALEKLPPFIAKPTILCETCMASFWGTIIFWSMFFHSGSHFEIFTIFEWVFCCIVSSFTNTLLWNLFRLIEKIINK